MLDKNNKKLDISSAAGGGELLDTKKEQIPLYIVSLKNSERRQIIEKLLKEYNYSYTFIDAINGKEELNEEYFKTINESTFVKKRYNRKLVYGELGCSLSHLKVYEKMQKENIPWAIIFEDDVSFDKNIQNSISSNMDVFDENNLYILGGQEGLNKDYKIIYSKKDKISLENIELRKTFESHMYIYRTAAYMISKKVALNILNFTKSTFCVADDWYTFKENKLYKELYLAHSIKHPIDLSTSLIEEERQVQWKEQKQKSKTSLWGWVIKTLRKIYHKLKLLLRKIKYLGK